MTREIKTDFELYKQHLEKMGFGDQLKSAEYVGQVRRIHQSFLALLVLCAEFATSDGELASEFEATYGDRGAMYLREVVSDVGQASHCAISGAYKASLVTLRSAIESYCKCFSLKHSPEVLVQKNVYLVFGLAKGAPFFAGAVPKLNIGRLLNVYDELNEYVHTVTDKAMFQYLRLGVFPQDDAVVLSKVTDSIVKVSDAILLSIVFQLREMVLKVHHRNQDIILTRLSATERRVFFGGE